MATVIKCEVDGISNPLELDGGLGYGYMSQAMVNNSGNAKQITFGPVSVTPFSFSIMQPDKDSVTSLIKWLVSHEIKSKVTFRVSTNEMDAKSRDIELNQVCLESFNENITEYGSQIALTMVGQKVTVDGVPVDQTEQR